MDWVKAPPLIELEIRGVWLEDEMPDEIKNAPGRVPFTLSAESQEWVDSMLEVKDAGKYIVGLPRPAAPVHHRPLGAQPTPPPSPLPAAGVTWTGFRTPDVPPPATTNPSRPPISDIEAAPMPPVAKRSRMPDIADDRPRETPQPNPVQQRPRQTRMPEIETEAAPRSRMSEIEDVTEGKPKHGSDKPKHAEIPDIGDDHPRRRAMPDIGEG